MKRTQTTSEHVERLKSHIEDVRMFMERPGCSPADRERHATMIAALSAAIEALEKARELHGVQDAAIMLLEHFNPTKLNEGASRQWHALHDAIQLCQSPAGRLRYDAIAQLQSRVAALEGFIGGQIVLWLEDPGSMDADSFEEGAIEAGIMEQRAGGDVELTEFGNELWRKDRDRQRAALTEQESE